MRPDPAAAARRRASRSASPIVANQAGPTSQPPVRSCGSTCSSSAEETMPAPSRMRVGGRHGQTGPDQRGRGWTERSAPAAPAPGRRARARMASAGSSRAAAEASSAQASMFSGSAATARRSAATAARGRPSRASRIRPRTRSGRWSGFSRRSVASRERAAAASSRAPWSRRPRCVSRLSARAAPLLHGQPAVRLASGDARSGPRGRASRRGEAWHRASARCARRAEISAARAPRSRRSAAARR